MKNTTIRLNLPTGVGYDIKIGLGTTKTLGEDLSKITKTKTVALISDSNTSGLYQQKIASTLEDAGFVVASFSVEAGEASKTMQCAESLHNALAQYHFSRDSVVIALGGGVVGDLAGFVASTYMRGVSFVQIPTTLLSMIDSSVGGKNGVNVGRIKNLIGTFFQPLYVCVDLEMLFSLPELEWRCGLAEMAKSAIIDSQEFSAWLFDNAATLNKISKSQGDLSTISEDEIVVLRNAIAKTIEFKARVVVEDETESGRRKCLNYGHTLGHAIEAIADNPKILHGIAISEGMRFAARLASETIGTQPGFEKAQDELLNALGIEKLNRQFNCDDLLDRMTHDKKSDGKTISFVLASAPGKWQIENLDPDVVMSHLKKWESSKEA